MSDVAGVDPRRLVAAMEAAGFKRFGGREGRYVRLSWPGRPDRQVLVPLNPTFADYDDLLADVLAALEDAVRLGEVARKVLRRVTTVEVDAMADGIIAAHNDLYHPGQPCPDDDVTCAEKAREDGEHG